MAAGEITVVITTPGETTVLPENCPHCPPQAAPTCPVTGTTSCPSDVERTRGCSAC